MCRQNQKVLAAPFNVLQLHILTSKVVICVLFQVLNPLFVNFSQEAPTTRLARPADQQSPLQEQKGIVSARGGGSSTTSSSSKVLVLVLLVVVVDQGTVPGSTRVATTTGTSYLVLKRGRRNCQDRFNFYQQQRIFCCESFSGRYYQVPVLINSTSSTRVLLLLLATPVVVLVYQYQLVVPGSSSHDCWYYQSSLSGTRYQVASQLL